MSTRLARWSIAALAAAILIPAAAYGDGDPASDVLLGQSVFYPYSPTVSPSLQKRLDGEAAAARTGHFPIRVALIASPVDLGVVPDLFGRPQKYADFLDQEISFQGKQPLLVVMPAGYGVQGLGAAATAAAQTLAKPAGTQTDDLARAAIAAVPKLAALAGHPISGATGAPTKSSSGSSSALVIVLVLAAVATAAALAAVTIRRRRAG